jgi:hypothetical protein
MTALDVPKVTSISRMVEVVGFLDLMPPVGIIAELKAT